MRTHTPTEALGSVPREEMPNSRPERWGSRDDLKLKPVRIRAGPLALHFIAVQVEWISFESSGENPTSTGTSRKNTRSERHVHCRECTSASQPHSTRSGPKTSDSPVLNSFFLANRKAHGETSHIVLRARTLHIQRLRLPLNKQSDPPVSPGAKRLSPPHLLPDWGVGILPQPIPPPSGSRI